MFVAVGIYYLIMSAGAMSSLTIAVIYKAFGKDADRRDKWLERSFVFLFFSALPFVLGAIAYAGALLCCL